MKLIVNAGHTKLGKGTGAKKYLNESVETRKIAYHLMELLADTKHEVIPAVFDSSSNNLKEAVEVSKNADLFISIHLNAGGGKGVEAYTWKGKQLPLAVSICDKLRLYCNGNRGVKDGSHLYVIKNTKCPAILIECGFVDDKDFKNDYEYEAIAYSIFSAILEEYGK